MCRRPKIYHATIDRHVYVEAKPVTGIAVLNRLAQQKRVQFGRRPLDCMLFS